MSPPPAELPEKTMDRLRRRARAAYWSRFWLVASAIVSWISFVCGPDIEGLLCGVLLTGMSVVEFKVRALFVAGDTRGAIYGWWNQCLFAVLFLIYGGYHGIFDSVASIASLTGTVNGAVNMLAPLLPNVQAAVDAGVFSPDYLLLLDKIFYFIIAIVGAAGQFSLACYYVLARR